MEKRALLSYCCQTFAKVKVLCFLQFHKECIDNWLLHSKPTCPIDGQVVWDPITAQMNGDGQQNRNRLVLLYNYRTLCYQHHENTSNIYHGLSFCIPNLYVLLMVRTLYHCSDELGRAVE